MITGATHGRSMAWAARASLEEAMSYTGRFEELREFVRVWGREAGGMQTASAEVVERFCNVPTA